MKNHLVFIFSLFFCQTLLAQDTLIGVNFKHLHRIESAFKESTDVPRKFTQGSVLTIETDMVYIINDKRYTYYKRLEGLRDLIETDNQDSIVSALIRHYESSLDSCKSYYVQLLANADKTDKVGQTFLDETKKVADKGVLTLNSASESLMKANQNLDKSLEHLTNAEKYMKKSLRLKWLDRIIIGTACLVIGYAIGSL